MEIFLQAILLVFGFAPFAAYDLVALLGPEALLFIFSATNHKITRMEGAMMLIMLGVYYTLVLMA